MQVIPTTLADVLIIEPKVFEDVRGFFFESFNVRDFERHIGSSVNFVQDNHSRSTHHVLRGLHYQIQHPQGKLVRVVAGEILDVVVDVRKSSPTFGQSVCTVLNAENRHMHWIPPGYAHGYLVRSASAEVCYKTTDYWMPEYERCILWNDPQLHIDWQLKGLPVLSEKDARGKLLTDAEVFP